MSIRGRVGRHAKTGGRHCQNWVDDQQTVITLLNRIPASAGGAGGGLGGRITAGLSSDGLFQAILRFEDRYFPGQRSGFVDPGGAMLRRMEGLALLNAIAPPKPVVEETPLDKLRRNVLDQSQSRGFTAGQAVAFDALVKMAVKHIDDTKGRGYTKLPWPVEMFGSAHVTKSFALYLNTNTLTVVWGDDYQLFFTPNRGTTDGKEKAPPLPEMRFGQPVDQFSNVVTEQLGGLLLFQEGECLRVPPYHQTVSNLMTTRRYLSKNIYDRNVIELRDHP